MFYCNRALEWLNMKRFFSEIFMLFSIPQVIPALLNIMFAWSYHPNMSTYCYRPGMVFKDFEIQDGLNIEDMCICHTSKRFNKFLDIDTMGEDNGMKERVHVRTMDISIVQHKGLRQALTMGLNHIPLRPTAIHEAIQVIHDTFVQVCQILNVAHLMDMEVANKEVRLRSKRILLEAYKRHYQHPLV